MTTRGISDPLVRETPLLDGDDPVERAVRRLLDVDLPALPVVGPHGRLCGIFGEREFFGALFPGYLSELHHAGFVPRSLEAALRKRPACRLEPVRDHVHTEHIEVGTDFSDAQIAEIFLHHRVLIVPVLDDGGTVAGVITRADFFHALAERFLRET
jgi:CBS domain-containing protein